MKDLRTIMLTTDLSETSCKAIVPAALLAKTFGAKVLLVHVGDLIPPLLLEYQSLDIKDLEQHQLDQAREHLRSFAKIHVPAGIDVEQVVTLGVPHVEIIGLAGKRGVDLIVMATHGRGFISHAILGSTTERVLRRASCPVLVVRDPATKER